MSLFLFHCSAWGIEPQRKPLHLPLFLMIFADLREKQTPNSKGCVPLHHDTIKGCISFLPTLWVDRHYKHNKNSVHFLHFNFH